MRILLLILILPLFSIAQDEQSRKLYYRSTIITDSGTIKGYFLYNSDSVVILSPQKRYIYNSPTTIIPVSSIKKMKIRKKGEYDVLGSFAATIVGFTLTAGLIQNKDLDNDGKTSFFELIWGAIEGTTSKNRQRRTTALIAGAAGGTTFMIVSLFANRKFSLRFPINGRTGFYNENKADLEKFIGF